MSERYKNVFPVYKNARTEDREKEKQKEIQIGRKEEKKE